MSLVNSVHLERGRCDEVAFVFSCPGRIEDEACPQGPAKGATGKNLRTLAAILRCRYSLPNFGRGRVWITNAWSQVEHGATCRRRSEARIAEVFGANNLSRLQSELASIRCFVVCCGIRAQLAVCHLAKEGKLHSEVVVLIVPHLGNQALNRLFPDAECDGLEPGAACETKKEGRQRRRRVRLDLVAQCLVAQIHHRRCSGTRSVP